MTTTFQDENIPYFIIAPDYRESSAGVQVMHRLCHLINESGRQAWMVNCTVNPEWNTPTVSGTELRNYRLRGGLFIAIYPEVVSGNPHQAPVVVRYMLNREAAINGNILQAGADDLFYWYRPEFAEKHVEPRILNIECYDLKLFCDEQRERTRDVLYLNRVPESVVDFSTLPSDIQILSMRNPLALEQLADLLKTTRTLYSYESSGTTLLAVLCGCPVVALTAKGYEHYAINAATMEDLQGIGYCWDDRPTTLAQVHSNIGAIHSLLLQRREQTAEQIDQLVATTQQAAHTIQHRLQQGRLENWLVNRTLTPAVKNSLTLPVMPRVLVAVFDDEANSAHLALTLETLQQYDPWMEVVVIANRQTDFVLHVTPQRWLAWLSERVTQNSFDWLHCIPAGSFYSAEAWPGLAHFLATQSKIQAVYTDELWLDEQGQPKPQLKSQWDWDRFSLAPEQFLKRCLLACAALESSLEKMSQAAQALEVALMQHIYQQAGAEAIRHYADLLLILPQPQVSETERHATAHVLAASLQVDYPASEVIAQPGMPLRVLYHHEAQPKVSLILLAGDNMALLERAVTSVLQYNNWINSELLVMVHQHHDSMLNAWLAGLAQIDPLRIRVINSAISWQPIALRNLAAQQAHGEYLCFIEPSLIFFNESWLMELMNHAQRNHVAQVGPKLIHAQQHILSAGVISGYRGLAGHIGKGERWDSDAFTGLLQTDRQSRLLNGQCLLVRQSCWLKLGGLDQGFTDLAVAEIDFSLKLARAGYVSMWTPHSVVASEHEPRGFHAGSADTQVLQQRWGRKLLCDPAYHASYSLYGDLYSVDESIKQRWPAFDQAAIPRVVWVQGDNSQPFSARLDALLNEMAQLQQISLLTYNAVAPWVLMRLNPDVLLVAAEVAERQAETLKMLSTMTGCPIWCVPETTVTLQSARTLLQAAWLSGWLNWSDELTLWLQKRKQTAVLMPSLVAMPEQPNAAAARGERLRVLCDTRKLSATDVVFLSNVLNETSTFIDWVIYGDAPPSWMAAVWEVHRADAGDLSVERLQTMQLNLAVCLRLNNEENRFKDQMELLSYQAAAIPALCSDCIPAKRRYGAMPLRNKENLWITQLYGLQHAAVLPQVDALPSAYQLSEHTLARFWQQTGIQLHDQASRPRPQGD